MATTATARLNELGMSVEQTQGCFRSLRKACLELAEVGGYKSLSEKFSAAPASSTPLDPDELWSEKIIETIQKFKNDHKK